MPITFYLCVVLGLALSGLGAQPTVDKIDLGLLKSGAELRLVGADERQVYLYLFEEGQAYLQVHRQDDLSQVAQIPLDFAGGQPVDISQLIKLPQGFGLVYSRVNLDSSIARRLWPRYYYFVQFDWQGRNLGELYLAHHRYFWKQREWGNGHLSVQTVNRPKALMQHLGQDGQYLLLSMEGAVAGGWHKFISLRLAQPLSAADSAAARTNPGLWPDLRRKGRLALEFEDSIMSPKNLSSLRLAARGQGGELAVLVNRGDMGKPRVTTYQRCPKRGWLNQAKPQWINLRRLPKAQRSRNLRDGRKIPRLPWVEADFIYTDSARFDGEGYLQAIGRIRSLGIYSQNYHLNRGQTLGVYAFDLYQGQARLQALPFNFKGEISSSLFYNFNPKIGMRLAQVQAYPSGRVDVLLEEAPFVFDTIDTGDYLIHSFKYVDFKRLGLVRLSAESNLLWQQWFDWGQRVDDEDKIPLVGSYYWTDPQTESPRLLYNSSRLGGAEGVYRRLSPEGEILEEQDVSGYRVQWSETLRNAQGTIFLLHPGIDGERAWLHRLAL